MELYLYSGAGSFEPIEGYSSLIWTERFFDHSEFQLKTPMIKETMEQLSLGDPPEFYEFNLFTHRHTGEIMMFENYTIETNEDGVEELTITGRSITAMLEKRAVMGLRGVSWKADQMYTSVEFAGAMIHDAFVMGLNNLHPDYLDLDPVISDIFELPQAEHIGLYLTSTLHRTLAPAQDWFVEPGEVWKKVKDALSLDRVGVRILRPPFANPPETGMSPTDVMWYHSADDSVDYVSIHTGDADPTAIRENGTLINLYTGSERPDTIFNWDVGDIETARYLFSNKKYFNSCYVLADNTGHDDIWVYSDGAGPGTWISYGRRATVIDGELNQTSPTGAVMDGAEYRAALEQKGAAVLRTSRREKILEQSISVNTQYKYKEDYDLGDLVTVMGDHGFIESMVVSEHIRTDDQEGDREFPTLVRNELEEV
jgi:ReqiPepy6 Gp37-like protein